MKRGKNFLILGIAIIAIISLLCFFGCIDSDAEVQDKNEEIYVTGETDDGFTYETNYLHVRLTGYKGDETEVVVPNVIEGVNVEVLDGTFLYNKKITSVTLPSTIKSIGSSAFKDCIKLESIIIPDSVTVIWYSAFKDCTALKEVVLPSSLESIGSRAFSGCDSLVSISIPQSVKEIDSIAFAYCISLKNINIPEGLTVIESSTFRNCESLESIILPESITEIDRSAFAECEKLESINFPNKLTKIGQGAFIRCKSLKDINLPDSVTFIGHSAFGETAITEIDLPKNISYVDAFYGCASLKSIVIPHGVAQIDSFAFIGCSSLESVVIPDTVTKIGSQAFKDCTALTEITIPNSVTRIEQSAFENCTALIDINYPQNIFDLEDRVFLNTAWLNQFEDEFVIIGDGVLIDIKLAENATEIVIPEGVKMIAFVLPYENSIRTLTFPESLVDYGCLFSHSIWVENIIVNENNNYFSSFEGVLFNKDKTEILHYPLEKQDITYEMPDGITKCQFSGNPYLKNIVLPVSFIINNEIHTEFILDDRQKEEYFGNGDAPEKIVMSMHTLSDLAIYGSNLETIYFEHDKPENFADIEELFRRQNADLEIIWGYSEE